MVEFREWSEVDFPKPLFSFQLLELIKLLLQAKTIISL